MSNNLVVSKAGLTNLKVAIATNTSASAGTIFGKFKKGRWVGGQDETDLPLEGWVINVSSLARGIIFWSEGKPRGEHMAPLMSGTPIPNSEDYDDPGPIRSTKDGWKDQCALEMHHKETGMKVVIASTSQGMCNVRGAFNQLTAAIGQQLEKTEEKIYPVVNLEYGSYTHDEFDLVYVPRFEVTSFMSTKEMDKVLAQTADPKPKVPAGGKKVGRPKTAARRPATRKNSRARASL